MALSTEEKPASRVSILDAEEFDDEIHAIVKGHIQSVTSYISPGALSLYDAELDVAIKAFLWMISVDRNNSSFGQQLLHLKFGNECSSKRIRFYGICRIFGEYVKQKGYFLQSDLSQGKPFASIEQCLQFLNIISYLAFLRQGVAVSLLERFLGMSTVSIAPQSRNLGYSFMTRELIWHGFMEMLLFVLPLINYHSLKRKVKKLFPRSKMNDSSKCEINESLCKCSFCHESPIIPANMGCHHVFCYYCLSSQLLADNGFECPDCGYSGSSAEFFVSH